jgi:hypothetical protein
LPNAKISGRRDRAGSESGFWRGHKKPP